MNRVEASNRWANCLPCLQFLHYSNRVAASIKLCFEVNVPKLGPGDYLKLHPCFSSFSGVPATHCIASRSLAIWPNRFLLCFLSSRLVSQKIGEWSLSLHVVIFLGPSSVLELVSINGIRMSD